MTTAIEVQDALAEALYAEQPTVSSVQFQTDWDAAATNLSDWGGEDSHTIALLPTSWRQYPDPTSLATFAMQMLAVSPDAKNLMDPDDFRRCPDFGALYDHLDEGDGQTNKTQNADGKPAEGAVS